MPGQHSHNDVNTKEQGSLGPIFEAFYHGILILTLISLPSSLLLFMLMLVIHLFTHCIDLLRSIFQDLISSL